MYKQKNKIHLEQSKHFIRWIKRKLIIIITAFMIGISNALYDEDKIGHQNHQHTEQNDKEE